MLNPSTGAVTAALQRRLRGRGHHFAVDIDPILARRFPAVDVACADAAELPQLCRDRGFEQADLVVSLLPWRVHRQAPIPQLVAEMLASDGAHTHVVLAALRWMTPPHRLDHDTQACFSDVVLSPLIHGISGSRGAAQTEGVVSPGLPIRNT